MDRQFQPLTIQQVSEKLGVTKHTLRFWEKELPGIIVPYRTSGGQRRYTQDHISVILEIKRLRDKGLSLFDVRRVLQTNMLQSQKDSYPQSIDFLAEQIAQSVKSAVYRFFNNKSE